VHQSSKPGNPTPIRPAASRSLVAYLKASNCVPAKCRSGTVRPQRRPFSPRPSTTCAATGWPNRERLQRWSSWVFRRGGTSRHAERSRAAFPVRRRSQPCRATDMAAITTKAGPTRTYEDFQTSQRTSGMSRGPFRHEHLGGQLPTPAGSTSVPRSHHKGRRLAGCGRGCFGVEDRDLSLKAGFRPGRRGRGRRGLRVGIGVGQQCHPLYRMPMTAKQRPHLSLDRRVRRSSRVTRSSWNGAWRGRGGCKRLCFASCVCTFSLMMFFNQGSPLSARARPTFSFIREPRMALHSGRRAARAVPSLA